MTFGRAASLKRFAAQLTLALFALRALVPVGYMPDLAAAGDGQVRIVICTGYGSKSILVDETGAPADDQDADRDADRSGHGDCAFGTVSGAALLAPEPAMAPLHPELAQGFLPPAGAQSLTPPAQGPPLGQRAPPIRLG